MNNCFSIYHTSWITSGPKSNFIAFDEGRTLPNLLGCLLSRRFPVHASERWPVFFRSMVHLFGAILNVGRVGRFKLIAVWSVSYFVMLLKNFVGVNYQSLRKVCATSGPCTSTRSCFVLNGSPCLIELTRCDRKSNQPSAESEVRGRVVWGELCRGRVVWHSLI